MESLTENRGNDTASS